MKTEIQKRCRFQPVGMKVREAEGGEESRIIEGCAVVFNQKTTLWQSPDGSYVEEEIIDSSCITEEWLKEQDVKLNLLHNRADTVARYKEGVSDSLHMEIREDGLYFWAEMPKCDLGDRCLELVKNGTYTGCSFEFFAKDYTIENTLTEDGREIYTIRHTAFSSLTALTVAMDPAYEQTSVNAREIYREQHPELATGEEQHQDDAEVEFQREVQRAKREARKALRATKVNTLW